MSLPHPDQSSRGVAVLVGAGPGDPGLITRAGAEAIGQAEVLIYDRLVSEELVALAPAAAERIYVGKTPGRKSISQEEINALLVKHVLAGKRVVRLKGGDPLVFGRGGEEGSALRAARLAFRVVPGVTAAVAAAAYAGIPLTDRRCGPSAALVTGHEDPAKPESHLDYAALAKIDTLAIYMGVGTLAETAERLIRAGRSPETPAAVIRNGTLPDQQVVTSVLSQIASEAEACGIAPPALVIVGEVVRLREELDWYGRGPLAGRTVVVTRTRQQASTLTAKLRLAGARVLEAPTIEIAPPRSWTSLDALLRRLGELAWLVFTSPNGVSAATERMASLGLDARALGRVRLAAVGPGTASALRERFLSADLVAEPHTTKALGAALAAEGVAGKRLGLPRADIASPRLTEMLRQAGAEPIEAEAYRTVRPASLPAEVSKALQARSVDWITFTSSSTAENFVNLVEGVEGLSLSRLGARPASIGPVTSRTLERLGLTVACEAKEAMIDALVAAVIDAEAERNDADGR